MRAHEGADLLVDVRRLGRVEVPRLIEFDELGAPNPLSDHAAVVDRDHSIVTAMDDQGRRFDAVEPAVAVVQ